ncbi:MAG: M1 family metallopeptidase [Gemmatimonadetes bacterium]|nr:M1 family metallopeptidase [Gemmatimonadota bacterium]MBK6843306.1 M1 family metallopeptidase [Gemmatimonadota bacterium]MBK7833597.1 M1 family metallopeptidase [Gemmatimonadota bacterium]HNV75579.1 M1 family metallopeptidase [Gemmatimonadaceae bacterium]HPV75832.1 M1 family metallopeptidase [Gemmatimonadaceae bacterium]
MTALALAALVSALAAAIPMPNVVEGQPRPSRTGGSRPGIDVLHYDFRVDFSPRGLDDTVRVASVVTIARTARADSLVLDLRPAMRVDETRVNGTVVTTRRDSASVRIPLPAGVRDTLRVEVRAHGRPTDGLIVRRDSSGSWTAFADHFPDRAREWLPTVDHPSDKATVEWTVRAPAAYRVVANGELQEETPEPAAGGRPEMRLTRWRSVRPLYTGVMVIGVAPFATYELGRTACGLGELPGCVPQSVWITPDVRGYMPGPFGRAGDIVALYSRLVGPFPYEKLAHVQSSTRYGGMENASAIFYADKIYRGRTMSEGLIAHESAHQWFGDAVTTREWPHVWLSEGFATYFAALWSESAHGDSAFLDDMRRMRESVLADKMAMEKPIIDESLSDLRYVLNGLVYQKAGFTLHMLRREVGDSAFFRGIRAYYAKYRHGNALTSDFVAEMERSSGAKLDWFFDQWMKRPGVADLTVGWRWDEVRKSLVLTVSQGTQVPPYRLNVAVDVTDARGKVQRVRVTIPAARVATIPVALKVDTPPRSVRFDADVSLLGRLKATP